MKKKVRQELLGLCQGISSTENILKVTTDIKNRFEILEMCQNAIITIGNVLEQNGNTLLIPSLEEYCENIYQESVALENGEDASDYGVTRQKMLSQIRDAIGVLPCDLEVVFLPYKASMWDCMESVWEAFAQQDNCSVHVVPIPYYEFDRVDQQARLCYEGPLFPEYVPVESYKQCNLQELQPDIAFIHNPYDDRNLVTSVAPEYYSANLKKYVKKLIYIPYYLTGGTEPDTHANLPVYQHMDYIITQSDVMTDRYVELGIDRNKILALGSPKLDALRRAMEQDRTPAEWKKKIAGRPVYFLNTSITGMLEKDIRALEKTEEVIDLFRQRRDCVLLWRPHPLLMTTIRAMRPALQEKFENLKTVSEEENIIVDETADVSRAVAISYAYIGEDTSSIVHLFGAMGKPVFLLDMEKSTSADICEEPVEFIGAEIVGDELWFSHSKSNAVCRMNMQSGATDIIGTFQEENINGQRLYRGVCKLDNDILLFAPHWGQREALVDIRNKTVKMQAIGGIKESPQGSNFLDVVRMGEKVYFIPTLYPGILEYDISSKKYRNTRSFMKLMKTQKGKSFFWDYAVVEQRFLYLAGKEVNAVICVDTATGEVKKYTIDCIQGGISAIDYGDGSFWLTAASGEVIVEWSPEKGVLHTITDYPQDWQEKDNVHSIVCCREYVYVFPKKAVDVLRIDRKDCGIEKFGLYEDAVDGSLRKTEKYDWTHNFYFVKKLSPTRFMAMRAYDGKIVVYDEPACKREYINPYFASVEEVTRFEKQGANLPYAMYEGTFASVGDFLSGNLYGYDANKAVDTYAEVVDISNGICGEKVVKRLFENG